MGEVATFEQLIANWREHANDLTQSALNSEGPRAARKTLLAMADDLETVLRAQPRAASAGALSAEQLASDFVEVYGGFPKDQATSHLTRLFVEYAAAHDQKVREQAFEEAAQLAAETIAEEFRKGWLEGQHPRSEIVAKYTVRAIRAASPAEEKGPQL
jgi:hypothetical protein